MSIKLLVGCDPEVFMSKDGQFVSAHGAIPGTKKDPFKVNKGAVQVDGMALEFNIDPASNAEEFVSNLTAVMTTLKEMVPGYELNAVPVAEFSEEVMKVQPLEAIELGCEPDFNAWKNGEPNPRPNGAATFRTGAGHVHIGWGNDFDINDPDHLEACIMLTKQLDFYLGIGSLLYDTDTKRRTLYGAEGAFRPKSYGVEYRVLSNAWLRSEELMAWVFNTVQQAFNDLVEGKRAYEKFNTGYAKMISSKRPSKADAKYLLISLGIPLPPTK
ncbi:hypothetical protein D3C85_166980 [compost metagenome]